MTMTPAEFYLEHYDAGDPFGAYRPQFDTYHRGSDINGLDAGTPIPSWVDGVVIRAYYSSALGFVVVVKRADSLRVGFCHQQTLWATVGQQIRYGQAIGPLGDTGTQSNAEHLHTTASWTGDDPGTADVVDPWPLILQSIRDHQGDTDMRTIKNNTTGFPTSGWTALVGEFTFHHHVDKQDEQFDSRVWNGGLGNVDLLNNEEFEHIRATTLNRIAERDKAWGAATAVKPPVFDYKALAAELKAIGVFDLVLAGTARPAGATK